jgi:hypothetical protein
MCVCVCVCVIYLLLFCLTTVSVAQTTYSVDERMINGQKRIRKEVGLLSGHYLGGLRKTTKTTNYDSQSTRIDLNDLNP